MKATKATAVEVVEIRGGIKVLGRNGFAITYANRSQAERMAAIVGGEVFKPLTSRPFFVVPAEVRES